MFLHIGCTFFNYHIPKFVILENEWKEQTASGIFHESANQSKVKVEWILNDNEEANIWYNFFQTSLVTNTSKRVVLQGEDSTSKNPKNSNRILKKRRFVNYQETLSDKPLKNLLMFQNLVLLTN